MNSYKLVGGVPVHIANPYNETGLVLGDGGAPFHARPDVNERTHKVSLVPTYDPSANIVRESWLVEPLTEDELARMRDRAWASTKMRRDGLLAACDWRMLPDAPGTPEQRAAWAAYRAALRGIPQQEVEPADVVWPVAPQ